MAKSQTKVVGHVRKKRFSAKVKTGCTNCKIRRIKCPEEKPECFNCLKSGVLCIYSTLEAKISQAKTTHPYVQSQFNVFDAGYRGKNVDFELLEPKSAAVLRTAANAYQTLCRMQPADIPFNSPADKAAFGFWLTWTGPMLHAYEYGRQFYSTIVPQFAWQSRAVRELILAIVAVDDKWLNVMRKSRSESIVRALGHYQNAIKELQQGCTSKTETLIASLVAWTVETMLYNYDAGQVHLKGARLLLEDLETETTESNNRSMYDFVHDQLRPAFVSSEGYHALMVGSRQKIDDSRWLADDHRLTYRAVRDQMSDYLCRYHHKEPTTARFVDFLRDWESADRVRRYHCSEPLVLKETMHLLFVVATTLLPKGETDIVLCQDSSKTLDYVLTRASLAWRIRPDLDPEDSDLLGETLELVIMHLFQFFSDEKEWVARKKLIEKIALQDARVFERTSVLQALDIAYDATPSPLCPERQELMSSKILG